MAERTNAGQTDSLTREICGLKAFPTEVFRYFIQGYLHSSRSESWATSLSSWSSKFCFSFCVSDLPLELISSFNTHTPTEVFNLLYIPFQPQSPRMVWERDCTVRSRDCITQHCIMLRRVCNRVLIALGKLLYLAACVFMLCRVVRVLLPQSWFAPVRMATSGQSPDGGAAAKIAKLLVQNVRTKEVGNDPQSTCTHGTELNEKLLQATESWAGPGR